MFEDIFRNHVKRVAFSSTSRNIQKHTLQSCSFFADVGYRGPDRAARRTSAEASENKQQTITYNYKHIQTINKPNMHIKQ